MAAQTVTKVTYVDNETVIGAVNLNAIQDAVNNHASLIDGLDSNKVDKVAGKGLSTNDYNNDAQSKLNNLPSGPELDASLGQKVDKRTSGTEVYTHNGSTQGGATLTETPTTGAVPLYGTDGVLKAADPVAANDVVRKAELDEVVDEMSDSTTGLGSKAPAIIETVGPAAIASFDDGADGMPVRKLVVNIEPVQDLHGYDHPWPAGGGKNLLEITANTQTKNGTTFTVNTDGSVTVSGTPTATVQLAIGSIDTKQDVSYIVNGCPTGGSSTTYRIVASGLTTDVGSGNSFTGDGAVHDIRIDVFTGFSGTAVTFEPMIRLASEADATFAPYSNICPISGWTGAEIQRTGKNLFDPLDAQISKRVNSTTGLIEDATSSWWASGYIPVKAGSVVRRTQTGTTRQSFFNRDKTKAIYTSSADGGTASEDGYFVFSGMVDTIPPTGEIIVTINDSDMSYEPYTGSQISVTFPSSAGTVYGGTLTVNPDRTGTLVVDRAITALSSSDTFTISFGSNNRIAWARYEYVGKTSGHFVSDQLTAKEPSSGGYGNNAWEVWGSISAPRCWISVPLSIATVDDFKIWLSENPVHLVYELATPTAYQLTSSEISAVLTTLYGTNNIWSDVGSVEVTVPKDTRLFIENLTQPTEDDMTADHAISAGTFFQLGNTLYLATAQIAAGGTITPGTNATKLSLADALNQVNA